MTRSGVYIELFGVEVLNSCYHYPSEILSLASYRETLPPSTKECLLLDCGYYYFLITTQICKLQA